MSTKCAHLKLVANGINILGGGREAWHFSPGLCGYRLPLVEELTFVEAAIRREEARKIANVLPAEVD